MNKTIWMYWATGWDTAPELVYECQKLWKKMNPDWKVQLLTDLNLGGFINLEEYIPGFSKKNIPLAAKSDIIRALLLSTYGGVWTDATVCPTKPLNSWLKKHYSAGFFAFSDPLRKNPKELHQHDILSASWFLMAKEGNYIMSKWAKEVVKYWGKKDSLETYFWFHYLFTDLYGSDRRFRTEWDAVEKISCNIRRREGPHLFSPYEEEILSDPSTEKRLEGSKAPMFKLSHHKKHNLMESRVIQKLFKLANQNTFDVAQQIPRIIWIYWAQGWDQAPDLVKKCRSAWERMHPDWEIRALTDQNIEKYINIESYIPGFYKKNLSKASKSDVLRMLLMYQYGGVWVDASSCPAKPLDDWLWGHMQAEFFAFSDAFRERTPEIHPKDRMVDAWFIASRNDNYIIHKWAERTISFWKERSCAHNERGPGLIKNKNGFEMGPEYFWFSYLFVELYQTDDRFKRLWDATKKIRCDTISRQGPSLFVPYSDELLSSLTKGEVDSHENMPVVKLTQKIPLLKYPIIQHLFNKVDSEISGVKPAAKPRQKVFCTAFHKCATTSLAQFCADIGYSVCDHGKFQPNEKNFVKDAILGKYDSMISAADKWDAFFDSPWFQFYELFNQIYDAKFIHCIRDPESWYASCLKYFGPAAPSGWDTYIYGREWREPMGNKKVWLARYLKHQSDVLEYFKHKDNFLLIDIFGGTNIEAKICDFLGVEQGEAKIEHYNKGK